MRQNHPLDRFPGFSYFTGARVLLMGDYIYPDEIRNRRDQWQVFQTNFSTAEAGMLDLHPFRMVETGRVDLYWEDLIWSEAIIRQNGFRLKALWPPAVVEPSYLGYSPARPDLRDAFETALRARRQDGRLDRLYRETTGRAWNPDLLPDVIN